MSSGPDEGYKAECEARDTREVQRVYMTGKTRRAVRTLVLNAQASLQRAKEALDKLDTRVKAETGRRAFYEEAETIGYYATQLERGVTRQLDTIGLDFKEAFRDHKHEFIDGDPDDGCIRCGYLQKNL